MPETFGRYELLEVLGRGGMGVVWRARDTVRQRNVALKVLPEHLAEDEQFTARFRRESRLAAQLNEPHIVPIHDFGEIDGRLFIDMRLVEGTDLGSLLETRKQLSPALAVAIIAQVASALDAAHGDGLVHRDVKPGNVMLTGITPDLVRVPFAYLVDFGIARSMQGQMTYATMTSAGTIGTIAYIAPERINGEPGDARSDVYALACVLYEAVTGSLPFEGEAFALLYKHVNEPAPKASARRPGISPALDAVIVKGMAKSPSDRYATAGDLAQAAQDALQATENLRHPQAETHGPTLDLRQGQAATQAAFPPPPTQAPLQPPPTQAPFTPLPSQPAPSQPPPGQATELRQPTPTQAPVQQHPPPRGPGPQGPGPQGPPPPPPGAPGRSEPRKPGGRRRGLMVAAALVVVAVAVLAVALINRGGSTPSKDDSTTTSKAAVVGAIKVTPRSGVKQGGTLGIAIGARVANFNVYSVEGHTDEADRTTAPLLPQPFHYDAAGVASVDTDYFTSIKKKSESPLTIEYKINPAARWSDGSKLSYLDFAGLAKAMRGGDGYDSYTTLGYDQIKSVTQGSDPQDVVVTFDTPFSDWPRLFAPLVPASLTATPDAFGTAWKAKPLVTSGPFAFDAAAGTASSYVEVPSTTWKGDKPKLDKIRFDVYDSQDASISALGKGKTDYAQLGGISAVDNVATARGLSGVDVRQYAAGTTYRLMSFNTTDSLLSDVAVRRAIVLATDRARMTRTLIGKLVDNPAPLQDFFHLQGTPRYEKTCGTYCDYSVARAKSTLEADGWSLSGGYYTKDGAALEVSLLVPRAANSTSEATVLGASLKAAGIKLKVEALSPTEVTQRLSAGDFQLTISTRSATPFPLSDDPLFYHYDPDDRSANNGAGGSPAINELLSTALNASNAPAGRTAEGRLEQAMWSNASWLPLYERPQIAGVKADIVNLGAPGLADIRFQDVGYAA